MGPPTLGTSIREISNFYPARRIHDSSRLLANFSRQKNTYKVYVLILYILTITYYITIKILHSLTFMDHSSANFFQQHTPHEPRNWMPSSVPGRRLRSISPCRARRPPGRRKRQAGRLRRSERLAGCAFAAVNEHKACRPSSRRENAMNIYEKIWKWYTVIYGDHENEIKWKEPQKLRCEMMWTMRGLLMVQNLDVLKGA